MKRKLQVGTDSIRPFGTLIFATFMAIGFFSFFALPWHNQFSYTQSLLFGGLVSLLVLLLIVRRQAIRDIAVRSVFAGLSLPSFILIGVAARLLWIAMVPPVQLSDAQDYLGAAERIVETGEYFYVRSGNILRAWRAPGYPFLLAIAMALVGNNPWIPAFWNLLFFALTAVLVYRIADQLAGRAPAAFAALAIALWPSLVTSAGLAATEPLSLLLLTAGAWLWLKAQAGRGGLQYAVGAGLVVGVGALARPELLMVPVLWGLYLLIGGRFERKTLARFAVASLCVLLAVAPWAARNYVVLGELVPVSTNGGDVFYRANNPMATGTWTQRGEKNLDEFMHDEALWNETGYAWGKEWILDHPGEFTLLMAKKLAILLGADDSGAYWTLYRGHGDDSDRYRLIVLLSNVWWLTIWASALVGAWEKRDYLSRTPEGIFLLLTLLYLVGIHMVFESQPRYHLPMAALLSVVAAFSMSGTPRLVTPALPDPSRANPA